MITPLKVAHRGDSSRYRENTLAAIDSALESGADIVEIDIRQSVDGVIVLLHDRRLERLWGCEFEVSALSSDELAELGYGDIRIPSLLAALDRFQNHRSAVMIDMDTPEYAEAAFRVFEESNLPPEQVIWCGNLEAMKVIRSLSASARIWCPWNSPESINWEMVENLKPEYINSQYSFWNQDRVNEVQARGYKTSAWTIDDHPTMRWASKIGIDSVTTNKLELLKYTFDQENSQHSADQIDIDLAYQVAKSLAQWSVLICQNMEPGEIKTKFNQADLLTEVDLFIEKHAREVILANFPSHNIVGEEFGGNFIHDAPTWYIDPVDGTTNFANRTPWSSFSLALAIDRTPLVAVTTDPWRNQVFSAFKDGGAYRNDEPLRLLLQPEASDALTGKVVMTELAGSTPWTGFHEFLRELDDRYCTLRVMGSGTLTLTAPAAGYSVGAVIHSFSPIDHLAAALIASEAGAKVLNAKGESDLYPDDGGILIAAPYAAPALFEIWRKALTN